MKKVCISTGWFFVNLYGWAYVLDKTPKNVWYLFPLVVTMAICVVGSVGFVAHSIVHYDDKE